MWTAYVLAVACCALSSDAAFTWKQRPWKVGFTQAQILSGWNAGVKINKHENAAIVNNPDGGSGGVLRVTYPKNTLSDGGISFYAQPFNKTLSTVTLSYQVYFPPGHDFRNGGKLPGLYGGARQCSGGANGDKLNCFSTRLGFKSGGQGQAYFYGSDSQKSNFCSGFVTCNYDFGHSIARGYNGFIFTTGKWHKLQLKVKVNSKPGSTDGHLSVHLDGRRIFSMNNLVYYKNVPRGIDGIIFSTFYGGNDPKKFASPQTNYAYFRNFQITIE